MTEKNASTFEEIFVSKLEVAPLYMGYNSKDKEIVFQIRETGCPKHEAVQRKYSKLLEKTRKNSKRSRAVMAKIVAESILEDWSGILDKDGNEVPATLENKIDALYKYKKLFIEVLNFASDASNFQSQEDDEDVEDDIAEDVPIEDEALDPEEDTEKN